MKITLAHIAYAAVFLLIIGLTVQSCRLSIKMQKLNQANNELALIKDNIAYYKDSINILELDNIRRNKRIDSLNKVIYNLQKVNGSLYHQLKEALNAIDSIPPEQNYAYLQDSAYVYEGDKVFPFNAKQVTEIRKTFAEGIIIKKINVNQAITIRVLQEQTVTKDSVIVNLYKEIGVYEGLVKSLNNVIVIQDKENIKLNKDIIKQKRMKYFFEGTTAVGLVYILISLIK